MADEGFSLLVPVDHDPWAAGGTPPLGSQEPGGGTYTLASADRTMQGTTGLRQVPDVYTAGSGPLPEVPDEVPQGGYFQRGMSSTRSSVQDWLDNLRLGLTKPPDYPMLRGVGRPDARTREH